MTEGSELRWGVEKRLEFIEFRLFWEGGVNRADITDFFGVSVPQASKDFTLYRALAPDNVRYDLSEKRYFATEEFQSRFLTPDADRYLTRLTFTNDPSSGEHNWLMNPPSADTMPVPHRRVDVVVLREILSAVRKPASIEIQYQSMNEKRPDPLWRRITPHAFGSDGLRWHVRALCHIDGRFKDFLLSRCLDTRDMGEPGAQAEDDVDWSRFFDVVLSPNPKIGENQRNVIAHDYGMHDGQAVIPVRRALLYYFQKRLRLDVAEALDNPNETPVVVKNRREFDAALAGG